MRVTNLTIPFTFLWLLVHEQSSPRGEISLKLHVRLEPASIPLEGYSGAVPTIGIENQGTAPIYLSRRLCIETWEVEDASGVRHTVRTAPGGEPAERSNDDLQLIPPGVIAASTTGGLIPGRFLAERSGQYRLHVSCTSPVRWADYDGIRVWSEDDGPLSTVFEFEVVPGRSAYEELETLEREFAQAWVETDRKVLDAVLSEDWTVIDIDGRMRTKADVFRDLFGSGTPWFDHVNVSEIGVRTFGDVTIVTGQNRWFAGAEDPVTVRFTDIAVRRDGRWQIISSHRTRAIE